MKIFLILSILLMPFIAYGAVTCAITDYTIEADENGAVFIKGKLNNVNNRWISLCGSKADKTDCSSPATDRRLQVALNALTLNANLDAFFENMTKCSDYRNHTRVTLLTIKKQL